MPRFLSIRLAFNLVVALVLCFFWSCQEAPQTTIPPPTEGKTIVKLDAEEGSGRQKREQWIESMHKAAPGLDWRKMESINRMHLHRERIENRGLSTGSNEILANGKLVGQWHERGSINQAGSVVATEFDKETEEIWVISAGGSLFKGHLSGNNWEVINQDLVFEGNFLRFIPTNEGRRLIAEIEKIIHYSDDEGITWSPSSGLETFDNNWGSRKDKVVLNDSLNTILLLVQEWLPGPWKADVGIYMSKDKGQSFQKTWSFNSGNLANVSMVEIGGTNEVAIMEKVAINTTRMYSLDIGSGVPNLLTTNPLFGIGDVQANLRARNINGEPVFFTYNSFNQLFRSTNWGMNWQELGSMEERPWDVGIHICSFNPQLILMGGVHCHRSIDGGTSFTRFNNWWDYYTDIDGSLHADMMYFNEFEKKNGTPFILISNHGGLSITYDGIKVKNISLEGLNVSQYYDVVTEPIDEIYIYAGSQDQGFQRSLDEWSNEILPFEQAISGDYGHLVFTGYSQKLWMVYPGGWVTYWNDPVNGGVTASWELDSEDESVWIPPIIADPDPGKDVVYLAGGNMFGDTGSYIIQLSILNNQIQSEQLPFDFKAFSGGEVSALAFSPHDQDRMYAATTNGYFFTSHDKGQSWDASVTTLPGGQYLYGAVILPSKKDPDKVYFGGSGYSNPAMFMSNDGGLTFASINDGLPPTLVIDLASDMEEQMIFAATESGPYVFITKEEKWYSMAGQAAPIQRYWSVEYLPLQQKVRFGTYGRGIWDFSIDSEVVTKDIAGKNQRGELLFWPNPSAGDFIQVKAIDLNEGPAVAAIYTMDGQKIWTELIQIGAYQSAPLVIPGNLASGNYVIELRQGIDIRETGIFFKN